MKSVGEHNIAPRSDGVNPASNPASDGANSQPVENQPVEPPISVFGAPSSIEHRNLGEQASEVAREAWHFIDMTVINRVAEFELMVSDLCTGEEEMSHYRSRVVEEERQEQEDQLVNTFAGQATTFIQTGATHDRPNGWDQMLNRMAGAAVQDIVLDEHGQSQSVLTSEQTQELRRVTNRYRNLTPAQITEIRTQVVVQELTALRNAGEEAARILRMSASQRELLRAQAIVGNLPRIPSDDELRRAAVFNNDLVARILGEISIDVEPSVNIADSHMTFQQMVHGINGDSGLRPNVSRLVPRIFLPATPPRQEEHPETYVHEHRGGSEIRIQNQDLDRQWRVNTAITCGGFIVDGHHPDPRLNNTIQDPYSRSEVIVNYVVQQGMQLFMGDPSQLTDDNAIAMGQDPQNPNMVFTRNNIRAIREQLRRVETYLQEEGHDPEILGTFGIAASRTLNNLDELDRQLNER